MHTERLYLFALKSLTFERPDMETFRALPLAYRAMKEGGSMPTVFNAANECAVEQFLSHKIGFTDIWKIIENCMDDHTSIPDPSVEEILEVEKEIRGRIGHRNSEH